MKKISILSKTKTGTEFLEPWKTGFSACYHNNMKLTFCKY